jgi:hypothetical protein
VADLRVEEAVRKSGLEVDSDTKGEPGSPPIVETIFRKIDGASIFVPDLTFVATRADGRPSPNPNVLIEYGWALKSLTHARVVPVMNTHYGQPTAETMPFDMRHLRHPIQFNLTPDANANRRHEVREQLSRELESAIRVIVERLGLVSQTPKPFQAMEPVVGKSRFRSIGVALGKTYPFLTEEPRNIFLADGATMWLRIMPVAHLDRTWSSSELRAACRSGNIPLPLGTLGQSLDLDVLLGDDGFGVFVPDKQKGTSTPVVLYIFHTGEMWTIDAFDSYAGSFNGKPTIPFSGAQFIGVLDQYREFLKDRLKIAPPYRCTLGVEGVTDRPVWLPGRRRYYIQNPAGSSVADTIFVDAVLKAQSSSRELVQAFFARVLDKCGIDNTSCLEEI